MKPSEYDAPNQMFFLHIQAEEATFRGQRLKLGIGFPQAQFVDVLIGDVHLLISKVFLHATDRFIELSEDSRYRHCNG